MIHTLESISTELGLAGHLGRAQVIHAAECRIEHLEQIILELRHSLRNLNDSLRIVLDHDAAKSEEAAKLAVANDNLTKENDALKADAVDPAIAKEVTDRAALLSPEAPPAA